MQIVRLTPRLCRAARSLSGMQQQDLSANSGVPKSTIGAFEIKDETAYLTHLNNRALIGAFEIAGLAFLPEGPEGGAGVRLALARKADH